MSRTRFLSVAARTVHRVRESATFAVLVTVAVSVVTTRLVFGVAAHAPATHGRHGWTAEERATLRSLSLEGPGPLPADLPNRCARAAARKGC